MGTILTSYGDAGYDHEGYAGQVLDDGTITGTYSAETKARMVGAVVAACGCGWQGSTRYPCAEPFDEAAEDAALDEWERVHARPVLRETHRQAWQRLSQMLAARAAELGAAAALPARERLEVLDRTAATLDTADGLVRQFRERAELAVTA